MGMGLIERTVAVAIFIVSAVLAIPLCFYVAFECAKRRQRMAMKKTMSKSSSGGGDSDYAGVMTCLIGVHCWRAVVALLALLLAAALAVAAVETLVCDAGTLAVSLAATFAATSLHSLRRRGGGVPGVATVFDVPPVAAAAWSFLVKDKTPAAEEAGRAAALLAVGFVVGFRVSNAALAMDVVIPAASALAAPAWIVGAHALPPLAASFISAYVATSVSEAFWASRRRPAEAEAEVEEEAEVKEEDARSAALPLKGLVVLLVVALLATVVCSRTLALVFAVAFLRSFAHLVLVVEPQPWAREAVEFVTTSARSMLRTQRDAPDTTAVPSPLSTPSTSHQD